MLLVVNSKILQLYSYMATTRKPLTSMMATTPPTLLTSTSAHIVITTDSVVTLLNPLKKRNKLAAASISS